MGIDRGRIAQAEIAPLGGAPVPLGNHIFLVSQKGYQDNSGDVGRYNPQRARALFDEAGWKLASSVRTKGGKDFTVRFVIPTQVTNTAELVQGMLSKIGVKVRIVSVPANKFHNFIASGISTSSRSSG